MEDSVLIITRNPETRTIAERLLHPHDRRVLVAKDETEACDILSYEGAAVVVLDLAFPHTEGFEILRRLRGRFETRVLPTQPRVIVLADWTESAVERLAVGLGADVFLPKPIEPRRFIAAIEQLMAGFAADREPRIPVLTAEYEVSMTPML